MEIFGLVVLLLIGGLFVFGGIGLFVQDGDRNLNIMKGLFWLVLGAALLWWGVDWFIDHFDVTRVS